MRAPDPPDRRGERGPTPANPLFRAVVEATEESVLNAMTKAETMTGIAGNTVHALPYGRLAEVMAKYGRPPARMR